MDFVWYIWNTLIAGFQSWFAQHGLAGLILALLPAIGAVVTGFRLYQIKQQTELASGTLEKVDATSAAIDTKVATAVSAITEVDQSLRAHSIGLEKAIQDLKDGQQNTHVVVTGIKRDLDLGRAISHPATVSAEEVKLASVDAVTSEVIDQDVGVSESALAGVILPELSLGFLFRRPKGYKRIKLNSYFSEVSEEDVRREISKEQRRQAVLEEIDGGAAPGDILTLTGRGYVQSDDQAGYLPDPNTQMTEATVELGKTPGLTGFDTLSGSRKGERKSIIVTFTGEFPVVAYHGKTALFDVTIIKVERPNIPAFTDAFAHNFGFESSQDLVRTVYKILTSRIPVAASRRQKRELLDALDAANQWPIPDWFVKPEHESLWQAQLSQLKMRGLTLEALGKSPEEAKAELLPLAQRRVRTGIVVKEIAAREGIVVSDDEIEQRVKDVAAANPERSDEILQFFSNPEMLERLWPGMLEEKVEDWILKQAEFSTVQVAYAELAEELPS